MTEARLAGTEVRRLARDAYERGAPLRWLRNTFNLSPGELREIAPEEFEDDPTPTGNGGY